MNKSEALKKVRDDVIALKGVALADERRKQGSQAVLGEGSHDAGIVFVGEAPGKTEAKTGRPFCGTAGRILNEMLATIKLPREEVYITNIVKDRPANNRDPLPEEIDVYAPFLDRQIEIIRPKVIATLGRFSMEYILRRYGLESKLASITRIHGRAFTATMSHGEVTIMPLYHPAATIYRRELRADLEEDFRTLSKLI